MQAAPITSAAIAQGTGADANAAAGGDLFAALMAALFNPAQAGQAALTPTGDPATGGGGDPLAAKSGGDRLVLPVPGGGPDLVDRDPLPRVDETADRPTLAGLDETPDILPGLRDGLRPTLAPQGHEAKLAMGRVTDPLAAAPATTTVKPAPETINIPASLLATNELVSLKGQAGPATPETVATPQPSTLIAAQTHAPAPQPLVSPPKARPATAEVAADKAVQARPAKGGVLLTTAQITAQAPPGAILAPDLDDPLEAADAEQASLDGAAVSGHEASAQADAAHAPPPPVVRGSPHTVAHLSAEIARRLEAQTTRFQVELEPAGLGKVEVRIEIGAEGALSAAMNCDTAQAADMLRARSGELQAALEQAGFDVTGGLSFSAGGAGHGQREHAGRDGRATDQTTTLAALEEPVQAVVPQPARAGPGRLDIRI